MFVLHSHWQPPADPSAEGTVLFWAETSDAAAPTPARGRSSAKPRPRPHPFCAPVATLQRLLRELGRDSGALKRGEATLLLPATRSGPQPAPQLLHDWPLEDADLALAPWQVSGARLPAAEAFDVLSHLPLAGELPRGLALGADARFWNTVAGLVLEVLARQKIVPVLVPAEQAPARSRSGPTLYHARWLAVLDGPQDPPRLARLQSAMPPICRAEPGTQGLTPAPGSLIRSFVRAMADALARRWGRQALPALAEDDRSAAAQWLRALFGDDPLVRAAPGQLQSLARSIQAWLRNLEVAGTGDFRVAFRLAPPEEQVAGGRQMPWQLHFLLQARDDPSLLVPAGEIWDTRGDRLRRLGRQFDRPQEQLLAGLGYTARLFPPLGQALKAARPEALALSGEQVFGFLREAAALLEQSGFGVLVPPWWNQRGSRLGLRLRVRPKAAPSEAPLAGRLDFQSLINYSWELSVGDTTLSQDEFRELVALKSPLVQLRGQWVQLDPEQIEAALRFWGSRRHEGEASLLEALRMGLGGEESVDGLPVEEACFEDRLDDWLKQVTGQERLVELAQPAGLQGRLRPYQRFGYSWLDFLRRWGLGACLADDMGLGKTVETLALLTHDKEEGLAIGPVLLICPTSVVGNWRREAEKFAPGLSVWTHQGSERLQGSALSDEVRAHDLVITSYALARRDAETLQAVPWRGVVLDEAQNIKNPAARQTQVIGRLPGDFRIALTGTPVENRLSELWSIMHFLNPGYLGRRDRFRRNFAIPVERYADQEATARLKRLVGPFILRRLKTDPRVIQDLPEKLEMKVYCNLTEEQASLYEATVRESLEAVGSAEGIDRRGLVLAMLMKLKQICDHPVLFLHQAAPAATGSESAREMAGRSGKLDRLREMLEEVVAAGDHALVFTQFAEMGQLLQGYLQGALACPVSFLHGGTPPAQRDRMVAQFQGEDGPPVFVLSLKAGGTGLNLMRANHVFHFDRWWNPAVEDQATDRAFRIGQTRDVQVHKFLSLGTLEEMIDDVIESKRALAQAVVGSGEHWLTELSTEDLRQLVTLKR